MRKTYVYIKNWSGQYWDSANAQWTYVEDELTVFDSKEQAIKYVEMMRKNNMVVFAMQLRVIEETIFQSE